MLETFILLAAFHQELNITFVSMISVLFVMKSFHWLAGDRVDYVSSVCGHVSSVCGVGVCVGWGWRSLSLTSHNFCWECPIPEMPHLHT